MSRLKRVLLFGQCNAPRTDSVVFFLMHALDQTARGLEGKGVRRASLIVCDYLGHGAGGSGPSNQGNTQKVSPGNYELASAS